MKCALAHLQLKTYDAADISMKILSIYFHFCVVMNISELLVQDVCIDAV